MKASKKEFLVFSAICALLVSHGVVVSYVNSSPPLAGHVNLNDTVRSVDLQMKKGLAAVELVSGETVRFSFVGRSVAEKNNYRTLCGQAVSIVAVPSRFKGLYEGRSLKTGSRVIYDLAFFVREREKSRRFFVRLASCAGVAWVFLGVLPYFYRGRVLFAKPLTSGAGGALGSAPKKQD